jgi:hypothetical protein
MIVDLFLSMITKVLLAVFIEPLNDVPLTTVDIGYTAYNGLIGILTPPAVRVFIGLVNTNVALYGTLAVLGVFSIAALVRLVIWVLGFFTPKQAT